ncbi:hypothetical protein PF005_g10775 [Phytophthora fragariae]|uniref:Uncharacterized protein n=3 Tax=Phytophthora fragariae TaxID=53985 RepID=A0A6A3Y4F8_9STRA|nr:hypothetical protein PF009_g12755 [Phytophthora fragariae]KAE9111329.1 hypothetical protein PF007_g11527 [Phytophthora fragariae]KAE9149965.1 hypothetical protein PF006_g5596 [Phytophthora fragariae]KAE9212026.1 hypothetical protein PF005_g10775 [Phytophthora fragariae]KAE9246079.1 hypothetical protein PF002_g6916 [Phytophthora fragariae]
MYANDTSYSSAVVSGAIEGIMQLPALPSLLTPGSFARATSSPLPQVGHALAPARMTAQASDDPPSDYEPASGRPNNGSNKRKPAAKLNKTSKGKKKAKTTETTPSKRFVWSNAMIAALQEMRFGDKEVKKRVERADINRKKALAWQYFASRLSEHLNVVVTSDQFSNKNKKLKRRTGIGGTTLADADNNSDSADEDLSCASPENRQKATIPIASLAEAMKDGMSALAASLGSDDKLVDVLNELRASQEDTRDLHARQLLLLEQLVTKMSSTD